MGIQAVDTYMSFSGANFGRFLSSSLNPVEFCHPDPEVEARHAQYESRVATLNPEQMHKQLGVMEKMTKEMLKHITKVGHLLFNNGKSGGVPCYLCCYALPVACMCAV